MIKAKNWKGNDLKDEWEVTLKIDGVRMLRDEDGNPVSRAGKPLHNLQNVPAEITDAEIFLKDWETSVSAVRTHDSTPVTEDMVYALDPLDERLVLATWTDPEASKIEELLEATVRQGHEGLVLRQGDKWLKVKPTETYDVVIKSIIEGTGKYVGMMGALMTDKGKVGTGFTDAMRKEYFHPAYVGHIIEVECMSLTKDGKFRHPRFKRVRWDK